MPRFTATTAAAVVIAAIVLLSASPSVLGQREITFTPCDDPGKGIVKRVTATPCDTDPCELKKGSMTSFNFEFIADQNTTSITLDARVRVLGIFIPVPFIETDMCRVIDCPVVKGQEIVGQFNATVPRVPVKSSVIRVKVIGDEGMSCCISYKVVLK